jgi:hypothetical protein
MLLIGESNGLPTLLTIGQQLGHDVDEQLILEIEVASLEWYASNSANKPTLYRARKRMKRQVSRSNGYLLSGGDDFDVNSLKIWT